MTRHYWMGGNRTYEQDRFFEAPLDEELWEKGDSPDDWDACWYTVCLILKPKNAARARVFNW